MACMLHVRDGGKETPRSLAQAVPRRRAGGKSGASPGRGEPVVRMGHHGGPPRGIWTWGFRSHGQAGGASRARAEFRGSCGLKTEPRSQTLRQPRS